MKSIRIGCGAGYSGDRIDPAVDLAERGNLDFLVFECLAERTIALAHQQRLKDPDSGFDPLLDQRMRAVLPACHKNRVKIISNMGAANPSGAARRVAAIARELGLGGIRIAAVEGDDVLSQIRNADLPLVERRGRTGDLGDDIVSANAYLGAGPIVEALNAGADIVLTGRVADPALFLASMIHSFSWDMDDYCRLGQGTVVSHLLECGAQVSGGYFADPGFKDVPRLAEIGFPLAEVWESGEAVITKLEGTGGRVSERTCKEQLLYELHDPSRYFQPDVVADFSEVSLSEVAPDVVEVQGGSGKARPPTLKVTIGYFDSYVGEGQISYAGSGALERAQLALSIIEERVKLAHIGVHELRCEIIGVNSLYKIPGSDNHPPLNEVRIRVAGRSRDIGDAVRLVNEVESLWLNGPAGGGGASKSIREVIAVASVLLPQDVVIPRISYEMIL